MLPEQLKEMSDTIEFIDSQLDRLSGKLPTYDKSIDASVTQLIEHAETMQRELLSGPDIDSSSDLSVMAIMLWEKVVEQVKKLSNQTIGDHRELHSLISKCGREIEKSFFSGYNGLCQKILDYENDANLSRCVNALTMQHLLLRGLFEGARKFAEDCNIQLDDDTRRLYTETEIVYNDLKQRNLDPALEWCRIHSEKLQQMGSSLEFNLHKLKFIELMNRGVYEQLETLSYARTFEHFADKHSTDIKTLMGALLYISKGLEHSPYKDLQDSALWNQLCALFVNDACAMLGLSTKSPLSIILNTGAKALPALLNIKQIMQQRQVMGMWSHNDELPISIELDSENRYHSVFSCPILRQQTTDKNPPMRLQCGHVISREALQKLASNNKLKCPYCPQESVVADAKQLYF